MQWRGVGEEKKLVKKGENAGKGGGENGAGEREESEYDKMEREKVVGLEKKGVGEEDY